MSIKMDTKTHSPKRKIPVIQSSEVLEIVNSSKPYTEIKTEYGTLFLYRNESGKLFVVVDGFHDVSHDEVASVLDPLQWFEMVISEIMVSMFPHCYDVNLCELGVHRCFSARRMLDGSFEYDSLVSKDCC